MADFRIAVNKTVGHEGGYVDDPKDFGGETKYGVSKRTYPNIDIIKLTLDGAREIYKRDFWDKMKLDDVDSQAIANEVFDTGVNCGWRVAATMLQNAINLFLVAAEAKDLLHTDGLVGSKTLKALRQVTRTPLNLDVMMKILNGYQLMHYINLVEGNPQYSRFLKGWISKRIDMGGIDSDLVRLDPEPKKADPGLK